MKPYYDDGQITIYHGDCREVLPTLEIELVITAPPYGMEYVSNHYVGSNPFGGIVGDDRKQHEVLAMCIGVATHGVLAFGPLSRRLPEPKSEIVWIKNNWTAGDLEHEYARQWELACWWPGPKHKFANGRPANVIQVDRVAPTSLQHPTEKPISLMRQLVVHHTGIVIDPFMGSGTTLRAAKDLGRKAIGIEIEERYCEIAVKRLAQEVLL